MHDRPKSCQQGLTGANSAGHTAKTLLTDGLNIGRRPTGAALPGKIYLRSAKVIFTSRQVLWLPSSQDRCWRSFVIYCGNFTHHIFTFAANSFILEGAICEKSLFLSLRLTLWDWKTGRLPSLENLSDMTRAWKGPCSSLNRRPNKAHCYDFSGSERCWRKYNTIRSCWNVMFVFLQRKYIVYFMKLTLTQLFIMLSNQWRSIWYDSWTRLRITVFLPHSPCNRSARRASNVVGSAEDNSPHASTKYSTKV